jgi:hypothetical protein
VCSERPVDARASRVTDLAIGFSSYFLVFVVDFLRFPSCRRTDAVSRRTGAEPHGHPSQVLCSRGEQELILSAGETSKP